MTAALDPLTVMKTPPLAPPLTTVVMVSYYTGPVLFDAIESVLANQSTFELRLVDNGNPGDTLTQLRDLSMRDSRLIILSGHGNVGFSRGCNLGAHDAKGEYLLFLNPDSKIPKDALSRLIRYSKELKQPLMIGARLLDGSGVDQRGCRRSLLTPRSAFWEATHLYSFFPKERLNYHEMILPPSIVPMPAISGAFMFLKREAFTRINGFDEDYFLHVEDLDFCWRFRAAGGEIYFAPDIVVTHIGGTSQATKAFIEKHKARGFVTYFHKNFSATHPKPLLWLLDCAIWARAWLKILRAFILQSSKDV